MMDQGPSPVWSNISNDMKAGIPSNQYGKWERHQAGSQTRELIGLCMNLVYLEEVVLLQRKLLGYVQISFSFEAA